MRFLAVFLFALHRLAVLAAYIKDRQDYLLLGLTSYLSQALG
ncbi:hypothetical protein GPLA_0517 [Paraglaciecola polaris LMG 21857]|uniref:Uncharacterized protein n=1 Tax=Paraglaciecola polaris LMG 21857 TaxID=1129793 RepID=K6YFC3_9ALTE|nr:hypothetical protein GPLA_0517 [Paraglaciecola polaris LMG 21857]